MNKPKLVIVGYIALALLFLLPAYAIARSLDDWQLLYDHLRVEIDQHSTSYPTGNLKSSITPYVKAINIFAKDREKAWQAAQETQASKDPAVRQYFDKFMDLVESAQAAGDGALQTADLLFRLETNTGPRNWAEYQMLAEDYGRELFAEAGKLEFDTDITREQMRLMFDKGLQDLDDGWSIHCGSSLCGELYPSKDKSKVNPKVDYYLPFIKKFGDLAQYFGLPDIQGRARELMNRYTKDALCLLEERGLDWYRQLAEEYQLADAQEHIRGFYGSLFGKVEIVEGDDREPASDAEVTNRSPKEQKVWQTSTDSEGEYEIEEVPLHKYCGPYQVEALHEEGTAYREYEGPLEEPSPNYRHREDMAIECQQAASAKLVLDHENVFAKEMQIHQVTDILEQDGQPAEAGSRLIVCAEKGRIDPFVAPEGPGTLMDTWREDPRCGVYQVPDHPLFVPYRGPKPDACGSGPETFRIYSACRTEGGKPVALKDTRRGREIAMREQDLICAHPEVLHLTTREHRVSTHDGTVCEYNLNASARITLGEGESWRDINWQNEDTGWASTKIPYQSIQLTAFDTSTVCRGKNPSVHIGSDPRVVERGRQKIRIFHPKQDYRKAAYVDFPPTFVDYDAGYGDGRRHSFDFFFREHTYDAVEPDLGIGAFSLYWLDQAVKDFRDLSHFGGRGHDQKGETQRWFEWRLD